eukprot:TRINITY_DN8702_c0_g1_i4.p1 TRINITY_DN8702_c0_g1~~TRINITY_DN8702_c0_g1_i4.p1  ORF type:complete len:238 (+),score=17.10 TRINITY_DN8702_c0_g1_i4:32-715(+)
MGEETLMRAVLAALQRGVKVLYIYNTWNTMNAILYERNKFRQYLRGEEAAGRYTALFGLVLECAAHPNFHYTTLAGRLAPGTNSLHSLAEYSGHTILTLHSKLTIIDGIHFTTGSANHVDISFRSDSANGHTEVNYGVTGRDATTHVLFSTVSWLTGQSPSDCQDLVLGDFVALIDHIVELSRANQERVIGGAPMQGHVIAFDARGWVLDADQDDHFYVCAGWNGSR